MVKNDLFDLFKIYVGENIYVAQVWKYSEVEEKRAIYIYYDGDDGEMILDNGYDLGEGITLSDVIFGIEKAYDWAVE